ncbi:MAG: restriction endonuclease [Candidatus Bathyarchaeia archaeon]|nr:hypothetical protein [Candidatus Bathyarchaeota archaeon]
MGQTPYRRGRGREYYALRILRSEGWMCCRSAASHSPVDIFAGKDGEVLLVQVKGEKGRMGRGELQRFLSWVEAFNARGEIWYFTRKGVRRVDVGGSRRSEGRGDPREGSAVRF